MQHFELKGQIRQVGNKAVVKAYRKQGVVPCNLYGLGMENILFTVDAKEPTLAASCLMTVDADLYYNPDAEPFRTTADNNLTPQAIADQQSVSDYMLSEQLDDERTGWRRRYYACLEAAQEECRAMKEAEYAIPVPISSTFSALLS